MIGNIAIPDALIDELKQMAEVLDVPVEKCATEAIARWLQRDAVGYLQSEFQPERPKLELVKA